MHDASDYAIPYSTAKGMGRSKEGVVEIAEKVFELLSFKFITKLGFRLC